MNIKRIVILFSLSFIILGAGCKSPSVPVTELKHLPLDNSESVIAKSGVSLDKTVSSDGNGSLRVDADASQVVRIFEMEDIDVENARLTYQARLRTKDVEGQVYLEMWCGFHGKGEFFSRSLQSPLTGTNEWTIVETPFFLEEGQNPDLVKLNVVIDGKGTVWIDDVRVLKGPLN